jgi:hypothetical protein
MVMSVQITMHDARPHSDNRVSVEAYYHLMDEVPTSQWRIMNNEQREHTINQLFLPFNGRLSVFKFQHIVVEFLTQEDLTQFLLTWS